MSKSFSQILIRGRYLLAGLLILAVQFMPLSSFWQNTASAADSGYKTPSATHTPNNWDVNTIGNIQTSNDQYVSETGGSEQGYSNFGFNIPAGSIIEGIEVQTEAKSTDKDCRLGLALSWNNGSDYTDYKNVDLSESDSSDTTGSDSSTWGKTWSAGDFSDANFVVKLQDNDPGYSCENDATTSVDLLQTKIYYSTPVTPNTNPSLAQACGLDIALVMDNSNSINSTEMNKMKTALKGFTNALAGTPTYFSLTKFGSNASVVKSFTDDISTVNTGIDSVSTGGGGTNWEDGLLKAQGTFDPRTDKPNLVIFASDGNPTYRIGGGNGSDVTQANIDAAVTRANSIKASGIRMLALGIGNDLSVNNLKAISGPDADTGSVLTSDVITADFDTLATKLAEFARQTCGGTVTAQKIIDNDGNLSTTNDQSDGVGWNMTVSNANFSKTDATGADGKTDAMEVTPDTYTISETIKPGYAIVDASCKINNQSVGQFDSSTQSVTGVTIGNNDIVSCKFYNRPTTGTLTINKVINGGPSAGKPQDFSFSVNNGNPVAFEADGSNSITLTENTQFAVTEANIPTNYTASYQGCTGTIVALETKTCTITNTYASPPELTVTKKAINDNGGTILAKDFSLFVNGAQLTNPTSTIDQIPNSSATYKKTLSANTSYTVSESTESTVTGYANTYTNCYDVTDGKTAISNPFTAQGNKKYLCEIGNDDIAPKLTVTKVVNNQWGGTKQVKDFSLFVNGGSVTSGVSNYFNAGSATVTEQQLAGYEGSIDCGQAGQTGSFSMVLGGIYECTITNNDQPGKIIVKKTVINDNGGTMSAEDFSFNVSGHEGSYSFGKDGVKEVLVANGTYNVYENETNEYATTYNNCSNLDIPNGVTVTCEITNDDIGPKISIAKYIVTQDEPDYEVAFDFNVSGPGDYSNNFSLSHGQDKNLTDLQAGEYTVSETPTEGWSTDQETVCKVDTGEGWYPLESMTFEAELGQVYRCVFVNKRHASISGYKFNDLDNNGKWNKAQEPGIEKWEITLKKNTCDERGSDYIAERSILDKISREDDCEDGDSVQVATVLTDANGAYTFKDLLPGTYTVCETQQAGWTQTFPAEKCYQFELDYCTKVIDVNFGNYKTPEEGGAVLGSNTVTPTKLTNTGTQSLNILLIALSIIGVTSIIGFLATKENS